MDLWFSVTGDSGMGITCGTIAGILLTDLIFGRKNAWTDLYDPSRKTLGALGTYLKETLNTATQYVDWVTPGDVSSEAVIPTGGGAIVRRAVTFVQEFNWHARCDSLSLRNLSKDRINQIGDSGDVWHRRKSQPKKPGRTLRILSKRPTTNGTSHRSALSLSSTGSEGERGHALHEISFANFVYI